MNYSILTNFPDVSLLFDNFYWTTDRKGIIRWQHLNKEMCPFHSIAKKSVAPNPAPGICKAHPITSILFRRLPSVDSRSYISAEQIHSGGQCR